VPLFSLPSTQNRRDYMERRGGILKRAAKPLESHVLAGMDEAVTAQDQAAAVYAGEDLTAKLLEPLGDVSKKAGEMERRSPLFFGTGDNPGLF
jgi:hypothetical protein